MKTWYNYYQENENSNSGIYLTALYLVVVTMGTIGYGDIVPKSNFEILFTIFTILIAGI